jgi:GT2 family glycosyltransferase
VEQLVLLPTILSICIVNWNTREHLRRCLAALREHAADLAPVVVVVDNGSTDESARMVREQFPDVLLLANPDNRGYAAGCNQALQAAEAEYKLLLNPDVIVQPGAVRYLVEFLGSHPRAGAVAPRLRYPDGRVQLTCRAFPTPDTIFYDALGLARLFPRSRRFGKYRMSWWGHDDERPVEQPMASALLLREEALRQVGGLDESFPIFFNDVDLCYRLRQAGWEVWFTPRAEMVHYHGASTSQVWPRMLNESQAGFVRFYEKHYRGRLPGVSYAGARLLLALGFAMRRVRLRLGGGRGPYRAAWQEKT